MRTKLRNIKYGNVIERTFRAGEQFKQAFIETKKIQFLYRQGERFHFMDLENFEQMEFSKQQLGDKVRFMKENTALAMQSCNGSIVDINLPNFVQLAIVETEPGVRANTVKAPSKQAVLETGAKIDVPLFIGKGTIIKIDTRTGKYVSRV